MNPQSSLLEGSLFFGWLLKPFRSLPFTREKTQEAILFFSHWLLVLLVFSNLFIPRFSLALSSGYLIDLRLDDLLFVLLLLLTLFLIAVKKVPMAGAAPVEKFFLWFLIAAQFSIFNGFVWGTIDKPWMSSLYLVKHLQYFILFLIAERLAQTDQAAKFFLKAFFTLGIVLALYGYGEYFLKARAWDSSWGEMNLDGRGGVVHYRLFERFPFHGDANHIGGFFVLWISFFLGMLLHEDKPSKKIGFAASLVFVLFPFLWTYSRKSFLALGAAFFVCSFLFGQKKKMISIFAVLLLLGLVLPTGLLDRLKDLREIFAVKDPYGSSWSGNLFVWKQSLWNFKDFFLLGSGLGSRHRLFYESQYVLALAETGVVGFSVLCLLLFSVAKKLRQGLKCSIAPFEKGIFSGWLMAFIGIIFHAFSCVSFTVSKMAIPFWLMTAVVLMAVKRNSIDGN